MCLEKVDDKDLPVTRDVIDRMAPFPIPDKQFFMATFIEMFFLTKEQAQAASDLADRLAKEDTLRKHTILDLPSGNKTFSFYDPNTGVQNEVGRNYQGPNVNGCSMEELMLAYCITHIDGQEVQQPKEAISLLDDWTIADVQYSQAVFLNLNTIDDMGQTSAKKLGKMLREQKSQSGSTPSPKASKTTSRTVLAPQEVA